MKKFDWKEFGLELLGGLAELLIMLGIAALGMFVLWLLPKEVRNLLHYDIEFIGVATLAIIFGIISVIKHFFKKNKKDKNLK
jgi:uncharacterized membrane protein YqjE